MGGANIPSLNFGFQNRLPVILQTEVAECGLACLAMVATYHGHQIDIAAFRRRFATSMKGLSLMELARLAGQLSLASRAVRADLDELANLRTPCILHWKLRHYVVLKEVKYNGAIIHDPGQGRRFVSLNELSSSFSGVVLELSPTNEFEKKIDVERIRIADLFRNVTGLKRALIQLFVLSMCLEVIALLSPIGSQVIFDEVIVSTDTDLLGLVAISLGVILLLQIVIGIARSWCSIIMSTTLGVQWTTALFDHLLRLPLSYFERRHMGDIVSRFGSLGAIQSALTTDLVGGILDSIMVVGALIMMVLYGGYLALIAFVSVSLNVLLRIAAYAPYRSANEASIVQNAKENSHFMETIRGVASIKTLDIRERRRGAWLNYLFDAVNANLKIQKLDFLFGTAATTFSGIDGIMTLTLGARSVMAGSMTIGVLIAFISYKEQFVGRVGSLVSLVIRLKMLSLHTERIGDIALAEPEETITSGPTNVPSPREPASIKLVDISFRYGDGLPDVLNRVSLTVGPGECVAITGPSGRGKTTLLKIIGGLVAPTGGIVICDDRDIRQFGLQNYRRMTATVRQDDVLFAGTIGDNIAAFDPEADPGWIEECARIAAIFDEIRAMPMGFDSMVGDMGSTLSGGQKQRLFLARALYSRPRILLLDEATSDLDQANEAKINDAVAQLRITRVIVAHRPSTIALAEREISLDPERLLLA
ncbi:peptidase domain-containing ABC transporter [Rhizobium lusitanum]|nr:peptidase domain-containing ABC transporter [Rhizobium lusitanum]